MSETRPADQERDPHRRDVETTVDSLPVLPVQDDRFVIRDPNSLFYDLLMEQCEQG